MELKSTISNPLKLSVASFFGCLILLYLNQNEKNVGFSAGRNSLIKFSPLDVKEAAPPTIIPEHPKQSKLPTISPPPTASFIKEITQPARNEIEQPRSTQTPYIVQNKLKNPTTKTYGQKCSMSDGRWVYKPKHKPKYDTDTCPFIEEKMNCRNNGRPDFEYEKWRWQARDCDIPPFDGTDMLERLRNKRVILVGDSLNRNMWESLACLLYISIPSSRAEVNAYGSNYKVLKAKDYNATIEFHWSPFLIEFDQNHTSGKKVLVLDKLSPNSKLWRGADVMVFNSGHWWTHTRKLKAWDLFQYKGKLWEKMSIELAYDRAMKTWSKWIQNNVDPTKTSVFFRSISPQHTGDQWCYNFTQPFMDDSFVNGYPKSLIDVLESLIQGMRKVRVNYLNITKLTEYRIDAHASVYWSNTKWRTVAAEHKEFLSSFADCIHWCLPGLPDTWNELFYASLFFDT